MNEAEERGDDKMIVYTCENCISIGIVCETTAKDGMIRPRNCPYGIMIPEFRIAHGKNEKNKEVKE